MTLIGLIRSYSVLFGLIPALDASVRLDPRIQQAEIWLLEVLGVLRRQRQSMNNGDSSDHASLIGRRCGTCGRALSERMYVSPPASLRLKFV